MFIVCGLMGLLGGFYNHPVLYILNLSKLIRTDTTQSILDVHGSPPKLRSPPLQAYCCLILA